MALKFVQGRYLTNGKSVILPYSDKMAKMDGWFECDINGRPIKAKKILVSSDDGSRSDLKSKDRVTRR